MLNEWSFIEATGYDTWVELACISMEIVSRTLVVVRYRCIGKECLLGYTELSS